MEAKQFPLPDRDDLPVFVYGLLKKGELGHRQIEEFLIGDKPVREVTVPGLQLLILDGIAYAIEDASKSASGQLLTVRPEAYESIIRFENSGAYPEFESYGRLSPKYIWKEIKGPFGSANTLVSSVRADKVKSRHDFSSQWSILDDRFYVEGIPWLRGQIEALKLTTTDSPQATLFPALAAFWVTFITFERTLKFCFGIPPDKTKEEDPSLGSIIKDKASKDRHWINAFYALRARELMHDAQDIQAFFQSWADFRNELRGKPDSLSAEKIIVKTDLMATFLEEFLRQQSPRLAQKWENGDSFPNGADETLNLAGPISDFDFVDGGLQWCKDRLSELRTKYERNRLFAEGGGSVSLQGTFLVAWEIFEVLVKLHYPNSNSTKSAITKRLKGDSRWELAFQLQGPLRIDPIWTQFNPLQERPTDPFCFLEWQQLRNNIIHRGKSAIGEFGIVLIQAEQMVQLMMKYSELIDSEEQSCKEA